VGARKPPLAVASVPGAAARGAGGLPADRPPPPLPILLLRPAAGAANSMSSFFRVFSRTFPSRAPEAEDRRPASFSLLLDTEDEPLDSVDALRWSLLSAAPVPLVIVFGFILLVGERLRPLVADAGDGFLMGEGFLIVEVFSVGDEEAFFDAAAAAAPADPGFPPPPPLLLTAVKSLIRPGDSRAFFVPSPPPETVGLAESEEMPLVPATTTASVAPLSLLSPVTPFKFLIKFGDCRLAGAIPTGTAVVFLFLLLFLGLLMLSLFLFSLLVAAAKGFRATLAC